MGQEATVDLGPLDEERIALRLRIAIIEEQGGRYAELEHARERLKEINSTIVLMSHK